MIVSFRGMSLPLLLASSTSLLLVSEASATGCLPPDNPPTSFWWGGGVGDWSAAEWKALCKDGSEDANEIPESGVPAYITTSEHEIGVLTAIQVSVTTSSPDPTSGNLYVAGWSESFDAVHGDPSGLCPAAPCTADELVPAAGVLSLEDGVLDLGDHYLRLGYRGGSGEVRHTGGRMDADRLTSIALGSRDSRATYLLHEDNDSATDPAVLSSRGIAVGGQGLGVFRFVEGLLDFDGTCPGACGGAVGGGYMYSGQQGDGLLAGVGVVDQTGGLFDAKTLRMGVDTAGFGVFYLTDDGAFESNRLEVGVRGPSSFVQSGGSVDVRYCLELAREGGSLGSYLIEAGTLAAGVISGGPGIHCGADTSLADGLHVGQDGAATFTVVGDEATIGARSYFQNAVSTLVAIVDDGQNLSPIEVITDATFEDGARLRFGFPELNAPLPAPQTEFVLMRAESITIGGGSGSFTKVGPERADWDVAIETEAGTGKEILKVTYLP